MHVLTTRGGELAAPLGPLCGDEHCEYSHGLAGLDSAHLAESVTVADHEITFDDLLQKCTALLQRHRLGTNPSANTTPPNWPTLWPTLSAPPRTSQSRFD